MEVTWRDAAIGLVMYLAGLTPQLVKLVWNKVNYDYREKLDLQTRLRLAEKDLQECRDDRIKLNTRVGTLEVTLERLKARHLLVSPDDIDTGGGGRDDT